MPFDRSKAHEVSDNGLLLDTAGSLLTSGLAAPTHSGLKGDFYFRTSDATVYTLPADGTAWVRVNATTKASASGNTTTTSATDVLIAGMTITPPAGDYIASFQSSVSHSSNSGITTFSIFSGGVLVPNSEIQYERPNLLKRSPFSTANIPVTVNGAQAIEARWRTSTGTATLNTARFLSIVRVA